MVNYSAMIKIEHPTLEQQLTLARFAAEYADCLYDHTRKVPISFCRSADDEEGTWTATGWYEPEVLINLADYAIPLVHPCQWMKVDCSKELAAKYWLLHREV